MRDLGVLIARLVVGGLLAGHGAQKLFGWFGGHGLEGTGGWFEGMGFRPGRRWAWLASASELGGGLMTAVGLLNPVGPLAAVGSMLVATLKVHAGKPIWGTEGGAELPVTNMAVLTAIAIAGPGRLSADRALGTGLPRWTVVPGAALVGGMTWYALNHSERAQAEAERASGTGGVADTDARGGPSGGSADVTEPARLDVVGESGAGESDRPVGPEPGPGRAARTEDPLADDAIAAATRATPES